MATDYVQHDDGTVSCPRHVEGPKFLRHIGCGLCIADPLPGSDESLTPEADELMAQAAVLEAEARGIPDMLALEKFADRARKTAKAEAAHNAKRAAIYEKRADDIAEGRLVITTVDREGNTVDADQDRAAVHWAGEAAKARMAVQKGLDVQAKLIKLGLQHAALRYRAKQKLERARLTGERAHN